LGFSSLFAGLEDPLVFLAFAGVPFGIFEAACSSAGSVLRATILELAQDDGMYSVGRAAPSFSGLHTVSVGRGERSDRKVGGVGCLFVRRYSSIAT
jgi:hypothetical protein